MKKGVMLEENHEAGSLSTSKATQAIVASCDFCTSEFEANVALFLTCDSSVLPTVVQAYMKSLTTQVFVVGSYIGHVKSPRGENGQLRFAWNLEHTQKPRKKHLHVGSRSIYPKKSNPNFIK